MLVIKFKNSFSLADILDRVAPKFQELGLTCKCIGGGRIMHDSETKTIRVYGYSMVSDSLNSYGV